MMTPAWQAIQHYIDAKDGNRPHLLERAFAELDEVIRYVTASHLPPAVDAIGSPTLAASPMTSPCAIAPRNRAT